MIVSHKHKYVFIQFPHTACTAVGRELVDYYAGEPILFKHAAHHDFLRISTPAMKKYFLFSSIRSPLDELVSFYFKLKSNHGKDFTDPDRLKINGGWVTPRILKRYEYIQDSDANFCDYLARFYKMPYANWSVLNHKRFDYVIRYENLQDDFSTVLDMLGLEQVRPIPLVNPTKKDDGDVLSMLNEKQLAQIDWVIGPLMRYWDYHDRYGSEYDISISNRMLFKLMCLLKSTYWRHIRHLL